MKVLSFLVRATTWALVENYIETIINIGHQVYYVDHDASLTASLSQKFYYNFTVVNALTPPDIKFDFYLNLSEDTTSLSKPTLQFHINMHSEIACVAWLQTPMQAHKVCSYQGPIPASYPDLDTLVQEFFLETVLQITRTPIECFQQLHLSPTGTSLGSYIQLRNSQQDLEQVHQQSLVSEEAVYVNAVLETSCETETVSLPQSLVIAEIEFMSVKALGLLPLCLCLLLNARKPGRYCYALVVDGGIQYRHCWVEVTSTAAEVLLQLAEFDAIAIHPLFKAGLGQDGYQKLDAGMVVSQTPAAEMPGLICFEHNQHRRTLCIRWQANKKWPVEMKSLLTAICQNIERASSDTPAFDRTTIATFLELPETALMQQVAKPAPPLQIASILEQFAVAVSRYPDKSAVIDSKGQLSYRALDRKAKRLAQFLPSVIESAKEALVAFYLPRDHRLCVAMLGILQAGMVYVPLDPSYPSERIELILKTAKPSAIVTCECFLQELNKLSNKVGLQCPIVDIASCPPTASAEQVPTTYPKPSELAYVIYTSGTTGVPKGVMIEHQALSNLIQSFGDIIGYQTNDVLLGVTTITFDIAGLECWLPLVHGSTLVIACETEVKDPSLVAALIAQHGVTVMQATPSFWQLFCQRPNPQPLPIRVLCGGEALPAALAQQLLTQVTALWNVYGPTETTIWSMSKRLGPSLTQVTLGQPIQQTQVYILDEQQQLTATEVIGDIYIAGAGLARGYYQDPDLTRQRFIEGLAQFQHTRLYFTGDKGKVLADGEIAYLGRSDQQVKIRGFRIELGDIEAAVQKFSGIKNAVATVYQRKSYTADDAANKHLVVYYLSTSSVDEAQLLKYLQAQLPNYMVPDYLVMLDALPLTLNGKLDRKRLPAPNLHTHDYIPAQTATEVKLCEVFSEVLAIPNAHNLALDFFKSGGNSILAIRLVNTINQSFNANVKISELFNGRTISSVAHAIQVSQGHFLYADYIIEAADAEALYQAYPLNNVQQAYILGRSHHFELSRVSTHIYHEYRYQHLEVVKVETAFNQLLQRHIALRTVFNETQQYYRPFTPYHIVFNTINSESVYLQIRERLSHKLYALGEYPMFDIQISHYNNEYILHISFDALVIDMNSFQILFAEWALLYQDPSANLVPLPITHRDYAIAYERIRQGALFEQAKSYWKNKVSDYQFDVNLPFKTHPKDILQPRFKRLATVIPNQTWQQVVAKAHAHNLSLTAIVLTAYALVIGRWAGQTKLCINLTLFNRLPLHPAVNDIIGDFTVLELFNFEYLQQENLLQLFTRVQQSLLTDIEHNLFDGIDFQRLLRQQISTEQLAILAPIVLTSSLGTVAADRSIFDFPLDPSYQGVDYAISQTAQVWIDNKAYESAEGLVAEWDYVEQLFSAELLQNLHARYCEWLTQLASLDWQHSVPPIPDIDATSQAMIVAANTCQTEVAVDSTQHTLLSLLQARVASENWQQNIALYEAHSDSTFTYATLLQEVQQLAQSLVQHTQSCDRPLIGILCEKSYAQVVGCLGIIGAGRGFLPLNLSWPTGRMRKVLRTGQVTTLLVSRQVLLQQEVIEALTELVTIFCIEDLLATPAITQPLPDSSPDAIAYVIFTSGSTGDPKGVTISHAGALNTLLAVNQRFAVQPGDVVLALSDLSFDLSIYDLFGTLIAGASIVMPVDSECKSTAHWHLLIQKYQITIWNTVPQLAHLLQDSATAPTALHSIRLYLLSGDWIPLQLPRQLKQKSPHAVVMSLGGATEGSIWSIWYPITRVDPNWVSIPYGTAMPGQAIYVLNDSLQHCPVDCVGEIYIGGAGVALNYYQDPDLTQQKYLQHPSLGRLYKTGDLGVWRSSQVIEFMGRQDFQVKVRGYRVELGEISASLLEHPEIIAAVATIQQVNGVAHIIAYVVPKQGPLRNTSFKLEQRGLLPQLERQPCLALECPTDTDTWQRRNSHHRYLTTTGAAQSVEAWLAHFRAPSPPLTQTGGVAELPELLSCLVGLELPKRALPKYRYPSAGSTYSIRCFVSMNDETSTAGRYYFHPITQQLIYMEAATSQALALEFIVYWPAIAPLYKDASERLVWLEFGHIYHLLQEKLVKLGLAHELVLVDKKLDADNTCLAKLLLQAPATGTQNLPMEINTDIIQEGDQTILHITGSQTPAHRVQAGRLAQAVTDGLIAQNIGTCSLGKLYGPHTLYALSFGYVADVAHPEAVPVRNNTTSYQALLATSLPEYMLPDAYIQLDVLPLSANGKIDYKQLPKYEIATTQLEPTTVAEKKVHAIWSTVLKIDPESFGIQDNFFKLGGNSLLAMQAIAKTNQVLQLKVKLADLYQYNTVELFCQQFCAEPSIDADIEYEEGVI